MVIVSLTKLYKIKNKILISSGTVKDSNKIVMMQNIKNHMALMLSD